MVGAQLFLPDLEGPPVQLLRLAVSPLVTEHQGQVAQGGGGFRVVRAQLFLIDPQGPPVQLLRLAVSPLGHEHPGQVAQGGGGGGVVGAQLFLPDLEGPPVQLLRLAVLPPSVEHLGQVVQGGGGIMVVGAQLFLPDLEGPAVQLLGLDVSPLQSVPNTKLARSFSNIRMTRPEDLLPLDKGGLQHGSGALPVTPVLCQHSTSADPHAGQLQGFLFTGEQLRLPRRNVAVPFDNSRQPVQNFHCLIPLKLRSVQLCCHSMKHRPAGATAVVWRDLLHRQLKEAVHDKMLLLVFCSLQQRCAAQGADSGLQVSLFLIGAVSRRIAIPMSHHLGDQAPRHCLLVEQRNARQDARASHHGSGRHVVLRLQLPEPELYEPERPLKILLVHGEIVEVGRRSGLKDTYSVRHQLLFRSSERGQKNLPSILYPWVRWFAARLQKIQLVPVKLEEEFCLPVFELAMDLLKLCFGPFPVALFHIQAEVSEDSSQFPQWPQTRAEQLTERGDHQREVPHQTTVYEGFYDRRVARANHAAKLGIMVGQSLVL